MAKKSKKPVDELEENLDIEDQEEVPPKKPKSKKSKAPKKPRVKPWEIKFVAADMNDAQLESLGNLLETADTIKEAKKILNCFGLVTHSIYVAGKKGSKVKIELG